jgi:hypothetical protein
VSIRPIQHIKGRAPDGTAFKLRVFLLSGAEIWHFGKYA